MDDNLIEGSAELTDTNKQLQLAAIFFLKEARLRPKSIESIIEEFAVQNQIRSKFEHQDIGFVWTPDKRVLRARISWCR